MILQDYEVKYCSVCGAPLEEYIQPNYSIKNGKQLMGMRCPVGYGHDLWWRQPEDPEWMER